MRTILYRSYGEPAKVLELADVPDLAGPAANDVLIRVLSRPVHPGDLLGVAGRYRAPGDTSNVAPGGNRPGFEGMGLVEAIGSGVDAAAGLSVGARVAFFPGRWAWGERVVVPAPFVTVVPADVPDDIAAQLHVNPLTAAMLLRAAEAAGLKAGGEGVAVVTAAASNVAKLVMALARQRGLAVIGLVRGPANVAGLDASQSGAPVVSTADAGWQDRVRDAAKGEPIRAVLDCVGGDIASDLLVMLGSGGTLISYGDLSGEPLRATALSFSVRNLRIHGVSVGGWAGLPETGIRRQTVDGRTAGIDLLEGEAAVDLPDLPSSGRSFQVVAGSGRSLAESGRFEVRYVGDRVCVTCIEGAVRVQHPAGTRVLQARQQTVYDAHSVSSVAGVNPANVSAWRKGELVFNETRLADVLDEINRYRPGRIVLLKEAVRSDPVSGRFVIRELGSALAQLQRNFDLDARHLPGGWLILS